MSFQVVFFEKDDVIEFHYGDLSGSDADGRTQTVGISDVGKTNAVIFNLNRAGTLRSNMGIRLTPVR